MSAVSPTRVIGGRYVVLGELGRGGMGVVWRAQDRVMGRPVAVKELHLPARLAPQERQLFRERLLREARTAGRLNDPGIVTVYDVVSDAGVDHIVMELIEAPTLAEVVHTRGPLDERTATLVASALLSALRAAHDSDVVHRDVKPGNVMLGPGERVRLTDFGIAQAADDPRLTATGAVIGSPAYLAPERLEGLDATAASDLWALGVTLFHAVQGGSPFARESTVATIAAVLHAEIPPVHTRGPLGTVISGLLQRSPQARLNGTQAAALLSAPGAVVEAGDTQIRTAPLAGRPVAVRRRWPWALAGLVGGLLVGGVGALVVPDPPPAVTVLSYGDGGDVPAFEIGTPACLILAPAPDVRIPATATVDCDDPHPAELFVYSRPFGSTTVIDYPDPAELAAYGASTCGLYFDSELVTGPPAAPEPEKSALRTVALVPSRAAFLKDSGTPGSASVFGDRDVYCVLIAADGAALTGTRVRPAS